MSKIISIHSFRGGTGKSNTTANLATLLAARGFRVGVVDTDLNSPGIHVPFGLDLESDEVLYTLNDFLWGECEIRQAAYALGDRLGRKLKGELYLVPASIKPSEITKLLRDGYDVSLLNDGFDDLIADLPLDFLLMDSHPGLSNETLLSLAITDILLVVMRPDHQDYQGTAVTVEVARRLGVPDMKIIINKMPQVYDFEAVQARVEELYQCRVAAILPHSEEMMDLASRGVFVLHHPNNEITAELVQLAEQINP